VDYALAYAEEFLKAAGIRCRIDVPTPLPVLHVEAETRYHLFLGLKEALNNVVRHAQATEVRVQLSVQGEGLRLVIEDNGRGFPAPGEIQSRLISGHGVPNLEKRLLAVGGQCAVCSAVGQGTRIEMTVKARTVDARLTRGKNPQLFNN
jgi:signal transduction histidine kinase